MNAFSKLLIGGDLSTETLRRIQETTFVKISRPHLQYSSFIIRIILSCVIATGGIASDSTAVVVGSMLIAPLMNPIMGVALAAVMGRPKSTARTILVTIAGILLAIGVSAVIAFIIPVNIDTTSNTQILSRTTPRLVDLLIALASSLMASIAILREDTPDALAGVAISASIIPPLCVVGVALSAGDFIAAQGSFLLFITNFFAIQVAGIGIFALVGLGSRVYSNKLKQLRGLWYGIITICCAMLLVPLTITSNSIISNALQEKTIRSTANTWLEGTSYRLHSIDVDNGRVTIEIVGSGSEPSMKLLGARLQEVGIEVQDIRMSVIQEQWYRPSAHPNIAQKNARELEHYNKGEANSQELTLEQEHDQQKDTDKSPAQDKQPATDTHK